MIRRFVSLSILAGTLIFSGCVKGKTCQLKTPQSEAATMQAYATSHGINATQHSSGIYYEVTNPGSGPTPSLTSKISVRYTGKLLDGTIFDSSPTPTALYPLSGFIAGWQIGVPLINEGGSIKLLIPSSFAYGCTGAGVIPANAILYFEIELVDVQ